MGQRITNQSAGNWRTGEDGRVWLASLIDTMEVVARQGAHASPCDTRLLSAVRLQLARPVSAGADLQPELIQPPLRPGFSLRT